MARSIDTFACRRSAIGNPFRPKRAENAWESQGFRKYRASSESAIVSRSRASPKSHCAGVRDRRALDEIQKRGLSANCSTSWAGAETDGKRCWSSEGKPETARAQESLQGKRTARSSSSERKDASMPSWS